MQNSGKELNTDQKTALAKINEVVMTLDFARDLYKQFLGKFCGCGGINIIQKNDKLLLKTTYYIGKFIASPFLPLFGKN